MDLLSQSSLLVGVTSFALGISVLARNVRNKLFITFAGLTVLISAWALAFFLEKIWGGGEFYRWHLFFNVWIAPAGLWLIQVMMRMQDRLSRGLLDLGLLSALLLSVALVFGYDHIPWVLNCIYFVPILTVLQLLRLMWTDHGLRLSSGRFAKVPWPVLTRRSLIYIGGLLVLGTSVMDHVQWMGSLIPFFGNLALTIYLFFVSQAVSQQRLLNFEALLSRFLVLLAIALMLTAVYSMLFAWIQTNPAIFFLNSFIVSFLLLSLLEPIRTLVTYLTHRLVTQKHRRLQEQLREAQRRLTGIIDRGALFQAILQVVEQTLQPKWAAIFLLSGDGTKYRRSRFYEWETDGGAGPALREMIANHPLLQHCQRLRRKGELPVLLDQILENEIDRSASRTQREHFRGLIEGLHALNSNLLIPFADGPKILGFIALRVPDPPEPWGNNWGLLPVIYPYFETATEALKAMEIYVRQREKERLAALGEMAAGLAHEIRNPLGAIKGAAQLLDPSADKPESRFLRVIVEEVDRLNRVVTQFLDYSKPPTTDFAKVELRELVKKSVETLRAGMPDGVKLELQLPERPLPAMVAAGQIHQVLINLIQNSLKAVEGVTAAQVRVSVEAGSSDATITVEDNGKGIKKEHLDKLFIPFFTTSPSGTGLGLSISQKIIEAHRGRIEVASEEGRFARFSVILPLLVQKEK